MWPEVESFKDYQEQTGRYEMASDITLQALYDSEINFSISTFWDGGFDWKLGDEMNGYKANGTSEQIDEAIWSLAMAAKEHYPNSEFVRRHF